MAAFALADDALGVHAGLLTFSLAAASAAALIVLSPPQKLQKWWHRQLFRWLAESPQLFYQPTPQNQQLLARCPSLINERYFPLWYLFNGHLQTLQLVLMDLTKQPVVEYERELIDLPDGGVVSLDWALPTKGIDKQESILQRIDGSKPTLLVLPGLTGGSGEFYIRVLVQKMLQLNWQVAVLNARGCAQTELTTPQLFSCGHTEDLRFVVNRLQTKYFTGPNSTRSCFVGIGFSMGSNVLVKYLGEDQQQTPLDAGISVGNPFDLMECHFHLNATAFKRKVYDATLAGNLRKLFFERSNGAEMYRDHPEVDLQALRKAKTLYEFDHHLTRIAFNYDSVEHYYRDASSIRKMEQITVPLLCLSAEDDPVCSHKALPYAQVQANANLILATTKSGGHLAFYETPLPHDDDNSSTSHDVNSMNSTFPSVWSVKVVAEYAQSIAELKAQQRVPPAA